MSVEPAIRRIVVFARTFLAHVELLHRRPRPVIREGLDNRKARPAIGAVGERVLKPPVRRIKNFQEAVWTGGDVRKNEGGFFSAGALTNLKRLIINWVEVGAFQALNRRNGRFLGLQPPQKFM